MKKLLKKSITASFISLSLFATALSMTTSVYAKDQNAVKEGDTSAVQILMTSDLHGTFTNYNYATGQELEGSFAQVATVINEERSNFDGKTIVIDNGDTIQGNGTSMFINNDDYSPFPVIKAMNAIGYDAINLGNHEFNFGVDAMQKAYNGFNGDKLCANVLDKDNKLMEGFAPYAIYTTDEGLRVAVIGTVSPNIDRWDTSNLETAGLHAISASKATRDAIDYLEKNDLADVYVSAAHMDETSEYGVEGSGALDVAKANPDLAVILGAHGHTTRGTSDKQDVLDGKVKFIENKNAGSTLAKVTIDAVYKNGEWVIEDKTSDFKTSDVKTEIITINKDVPANEEVLEITKDADAEARNYITKTVIGKLEGGSLVPDAEIKGTSELYLQDTALIDLINNVMLHYSGADIAGTAPLDAKANAVPGDITIGNVVQIYKYDNNTLYNLEMTGEQVKKWMEWSYKYYGSTVDGKVDHTKPAVNYDTDLTIPYGTTRGYNFDQFSGIDYKVDLTKPVGERITIVSMSDGTDFDMNKVYKVAANNYRSSTQLLVNNEDGVFKPGEETAKLLEADIQNEAGLTSMMDLIISYIQSKPDATITNDVDNNWEFINVAWDEDARKKAIELINNDTIKTDFLTPVTKDMVANVDNKDEVIELVPLEPTKPETVVTVPTRVEPTVSQKTEIYIVKSGDTLSSISYMYYKNANRWQEIYDANRDTISNPNMIYIGQKVNIPTK